MHGDDKFYLAQHRTTCPTLLAPRPWPRAGLAAAGGRRWFSPGLSAGRRLAWWCDVDRQDAQRQSIAPLFIDRSPPTLALQGDAIRRLPRKCELADGHYYGTEGGALRRVSFVLYSIPA
jgi:hypothetical protein